MGKKSVWEVACLCVNDGYRGLHPREGMKAVLCVVSEKEMPHTLWRELLLR